MENFVMGFRLGVRMMAECMDEDDGDTLEEAQDEIFQRRNAVDIMLGSNEFCQDHLLGFVKLLCKLAFVAGDTIRRPLQLRAGCHLPFAGDDVSVVEIF